MTPLPPQTSPATPAPDAQAEDASLLDELSPVEFEALRWSVRVADGLDAQAREQFAAWLAAAPAHRDTYEEMAGVIAAVDALPAAGAAHLSARVVIDSAAASAAADLHARQPAASAPAAGGAAPPHTLHTARAPRESVAAPAERAGSPAQPGGETMAPAARRAWLHYALASVALMATLGGGWTGWRHWQQQPTFTQHYATARGQQLNTALPDGSQLQLDTATTTDVTLYRDRREVRLAEGQAVFKVHGDKARPFDVLAGGARITVVGTRFAVRHLGAGDAQSMQLAVMEGKVRVEGAGEVRFLTPGQTISAARNGQLSEISAMPVDAMASWLNGRLSFDNVALGEVLEELARYGDTGLRLHDAAVGRLTVTASVNLRDPQGFARSLPRVLPVRLRPLAGGGAEIIAAK